MSPNHLSIEVMLKVYFYDVDPMKLVWHGNYAKYYEVARCALLDEIGYNYEQMEESGYMWPIVSMKSRYMRPLVNSQKFIVKATLLEYENRIKIGYTIFDQDKKEKLHTAETIQMAVNMETGESQIVSPVCLLDAVERVINKN